MSKAGHLKIEKLVAIDTHVHIESDDAHSVNKAARKYFGAADGLLRLRTGPRTRVSECFLGSFGRATHQESLLAALAGSAGLDWF